MNEFQKIVNIISCLSVIHILRPLQSARYDKEPIILTNHCLNGLNKQENHHLLNCKSKNRRSKTCSFHSPKYDTDHKTRVFVFCLNRKRKTQKSEKLNLSSNKQIWR